MTVPESEIDFFDALRRGLQKIASQEADSVRTDWLRKPDERAAPTRTEPVAEVDLSLTDFLAPKTDRPRVEQPP